MAWIFNPLEFTLSNLPITKILQFGQGLYCSDAAASAAMYGFTAVDRSEGYLILAVVAMGDEVLELTEPKEVLCCWNPDPFLKVVIPMLFTYHSKVCECCWVTFLDWTAVFDSCVILWRSMNKHHTHKSIRKIRLSLTILSTTPHSIVNNTGR